MLRININVQKREKAGEGEIERDCWSVGEWELFIKISMSYIMFVVWEFSTSNNKSSHD